MPQSPSDKRRARAKAIIEEVAAKVHQTDPEYGYWHLSPQQRSELRKWMIMKYTEAIAADESYSDAYVERGTELYFDKQLEEARADMRKAFALQPADQRLYLSMSFPFEGEERRNILRAGMALGTPESIDYQQLRMSYIQTFWYQGDFSEYVRLLQEWIPQLDPNDFMYRFQVESLASGLSALGEHQNAEKTYRTLLETGVSALSQAVTERDHVPQLIIRTLMHRDQYEDAIAALREFADRIAGDELSVLKAVLQVLASPGSDDSRSACRAALPAAESLGRAPGPVGSSTSYYSFLLGIIYVGVEREEARELLIRFADESAANRSEWGVTLRWEIAKARELAAVL